MTDDQIEFIKSQLRGLGDVHLKKMFGGIGIFYEGIMFGMIGGGVFRLKANEETKKDYESRSMGPFIYSKGKKPMPYFEVPVEILEDHDQLKIWALKAYQVALQSKKK